jgi:hypothetical protein
MVQKADMSGTEDISNWQAVDLMVDSVRAYSQASRSKLRELLGRTNLLFRPLSDPLSEDVGLNRWLSEDNEESYSDWLAWILELLDGEQILGVLNIKSRGIIEACRGITPTIEREKWTTA